MEERKVTKREYWLNWFHGYQHNGDWFKQSYISGVQSILQSSITEDEKLQELKEMDLAYKRVQSGG